MIYKAKITIRPKFISINFILHLKKIGSIKAVKKAPVLIATIATDTFDILMALKKKTQCRAIIPPVNRNFIIPF